MIGVDLVFIPEFQRQIELGGSVLINKTFVSSELKNSLSEHLAGLWAAKEAVVKASATKPKKMTDIVISHDELGKPYAVVGLQEFAISISHHGDYAVAVAYRIDG